MRKLPVLFLIFGLSLGACAGEDDSPCGPACPSSSVCMDADGLGAWECYVDTEPPVLACADDRHCPSDGRCTNSVCVRNCGCVEDSACGENMLCVNEDQGCGLCLPAADFACASNADCVVVVDLRQCCPCPKPRAASVREADPCLVDFPHAGDLPEACRPDCSQVDHCWPCPPAPEQASCSLAGICKS